jgi:cytochrome P450
MNGFDPFSAAATEDPYPQYARLRLEDPVHWSAKLRAWVLFRWEDVTAAFRDDERFSSDRSKAQRANRGAAGAPVQPIRTVTSDPPECLPMRAMLNTALGARVRTMAAFVEQRVTVLLDRLAADGDAEVDLVERLAYPLPIDVIAELMAIPEVDRPRFREQSNAIARGMDRFYGGNDARQGLREIGAYFLTLIQERRGTPGDDLVRALLHAEHRGDRLTDLEAVAMCTALVFGGFETTVGLIANGTLALLRHPDQLARLRGDPALLTSAIEELLRWDSPPQMISRVAATDFALSGQTLRAGDSVLLCLGAANRDPAAFTEPDRLDLGREPNPHVAFGLGTHFCPGAQLARLEARLALGGLVRRFPGLRLGERPAVRRRTLVLRSLECLPVRVGPS